MRIKDYKIFVVGNPPPGRGGRYFTFVKLVTDSGIEGVGEVYSAPFHPHTVERMIADVIERRVIGRDPHRIEELWRILYSENYTQRPDVSMSAIISGVETAMWDIIGKSAGKPVHELLGGRVRDRLRTYTYIYEEEGDAESAYTHPETAAKHAAAYAAKGFTAVKFDPVGPYTAFDPRQLSLEAMDQAERMTRALREAVGGRCDILFGTHGQMTPSAALRLAARLEPYEPLWFEEPTPPENPEDMAKVARGCRIPVATGERLATKYEFRRVLETGAAAILQPDLGRVGGILEAKKIAGMAEAFYAQIAPHLYCGPVVGAANIQFAATCPNFLILEGIADWGGFHADLLKIPIRWEDGYVEVPDTPGLGVELNEDVALAHPYKGDEMHLSVSHDPL
ncbi:MAG: mandelate racemase/muconate lactonizing enzyme family protein [Rhodospirillales bacterium]